MDQAQHTLFAVAAPGLEAAVETECVALGWAPSRELGGVQLTVPSGALFHRLAEANLRLRSASRVLLRLGKGPAPDPEALRKTLVRLDPRSLTGQVPLAISGSVERSKLGRVDRLVESAEQAWKVSRTDAADAQEVLVRIEDDVCTVSLDTSGELLYRRGYRQEISRAPMRETLAAGLLILAGYTGADALWDPLCGSGTIPIEAALIALRRAPGLSRSFAFERWPQARADALQALRERLAAEAVLKTPAPIFGTDLHAGSLGTARRNARRAGVVESLRLERQDVTKLTLSAPSERGLVIANLPYGIRVGEKRELEALYRGLSRTLRERFGGWRVALYVAKDSPTQALALEAERRLGIPNGGIRCELLLASVP